jgi:hypothetical protein
MLIIPVKLFAIKKQIPQHNGIVFTIAKGYNSDKTYISQTKPGGAQLHMLINIHVKLHDYRLYTF